MKRLASIVALLAVLSCPALSQTFPGSGVPGSAYIAGAPPGGNIFTPTPNWAGAGGTADAITATYTPALTTLVDGIAASFRATAANATTTPTFSPNGLTPRVITKKGGGALVAGDIPGNFAEVVLRYNLANTRWEMINPGSTSGGGLSPIAADNVLGNPTAGSAIPIGMLLSNCAGGSNALNYSTSTHLFSCNVITAGSATTITVASTTVASGSAGRVLFDNGTLGEYAISGTGNVAMTTSPAFTTPSLGVATATSINGLAITGSGTAAFGSGGTVTYTIASGTAALGTSSIGTNACASAVIVGATGTATTDAIIASFNGSPIAVTGYVPLTTGMLTIIPYPTTNNVNFLVCNNTASPITPGAITLNWRVVR